MRDEQPRIESGRMFILNVLRIGKPRKELNSKKSRVIKYEHLEKKVF